MAADTLAAVLFFVLAGALFPLAIGPAPEVLARLAPGVVWVCALLAALLPLDRLFGADGEDGSLDQLLLCGLPAAAVALAKALAHWLVTGLPLLLAAGPLALMLRMDPAVLPALLAGLLPGTAVLSLLGTHGGRDRAGRAARRRAAAAAAAAAGDAGADLRRRGSRRGGQRPDAASAPPAALRAARRGAAALPAGGGGGPAGRRRLSHPHPMPPGAAAFAGHVRPCHTVRTSPRR